MGIGWAILWFVLSIAVVGAILYWLGELDRKDRERRLRTPLAAPASSPVAAGEAVAEGSAAVQQAVGVAASEATATSGAADPASAPQGDDLKLIKGVGVAIEQKLHAIGVTRFQQIAEFTEADIERVSKELNFSGRIQREQWVAQAKELLQRAG